jgi:hypothetical protein
MIVQFGMYTAHLQREGEKRAFCMSLLSARGLVDVKEYCGLRLKKHSLQDGILRIQADLRTDDSGVQEIVFEAPICEEMDLRASVSNISLSMRRQPVWPHISIY